MRNHEMTRFALLYVSLLGTLNCAGRMLERVFCSIWEAGCLFVWLKTSIDLYQKYVRVRE